MLVLSKRQIYEGKFFQILWLSHNILTLKILMVDFNTYLFCMSKIIMNCESINLSQNYVWSWLDVITKI